MRVLLFLFVLVIVNLPVINEAWTSHQLSEDGRDVTATIVANRVESGNHLIDYVLPEDIDPGKRRFSTQLVEAAYDKAVAAGGLVVRVLPDKPGTNRPQGEVESSLFTWVAVGGDLILLGVLVAWWRRRGRRTAAPAAPVDPSGGMYPGRL